MRCLIRARFATREGARATVTGPRQRTRFCRLCAWWHVEHRNPANPSRLRRRERRAARPGAA